MSRSDTGPATEAPDRLVAGHDTPVLKVTEVVTQFPIRSSFLKRTIGAVHAVDGVSLEIGRGETLGLVGESGCGKSTFARTVIGLNRPVSGTVELNGVDITGVDTKHMRAHRRQMQLVFQDPYGSLNPRMRVKDIVAEPLIAYGIGSRSEIRAKVLESLEFVGLSAAQSRRYPHEFSGGQRQRIGIARALVLRPDLLILDEPVSALDVSIQAQILNLLTDLQTELGFSCLLIAHDLAVVRHIAHRVAVMYLGRVVEIGSSDAIFEHPNHPYTQGLLAAVPAPDPTGTSMVDRVLIEGDLPSPKNPPSGCRFRTRCWKAEQHCADVYPPLEPQDEGHLVSCHYPDERPEVSLR